MERYEKETTLGEGAFGIVFLAKDKVTEEKVAIKRFKRGKYNDGVNFTALREIKLQQELQHPNITALLDVFIDEDTVNLVFELLPTSLDDIIKCKEIVLHPADIKSFLYMILQATAFCHEHTILHRDLKPENLLLSPKTYLLKLADFGLGKVYGTPNRNMTSTVCTIWYRAPELLYGAREYSYAVDMWAIGCILGEMILRIPLFAGMNDLDQLGKIFHLLGTPTEEQWPEMSTLPNYIEFSAHSGIALSAVFGKSTTEDTLDLLSKLLQINPNKRITAQEALQHPYFTNAPLPTKPEKLPRLSK